MYVFITWLLKETDREASEKVERVCVVVEYDITCAHDIEMSLSMTICVRKKDSL